MNWPFSQNSYWESEPILRGYTHHKPRDRQRSAVFSPKKFLCFTGPSPFVIACIFFIVCIFGIYLTNVWIAQYYSVAAAYKKYVSKPGGADQEYPFPQLENLILVACHSVYIGLHFDDPQALTSWYLEDYQKVPGQTRSFLQHIQLGVIEAHHDPTSMLLFSGGQTRREAGPRAESQGYWQVAEASKWFSHPDVRARAFTEEHSRDSYENVVFGLCRFFELTGHAPKKITVVSYSFKEERFADLHMQAIRWPRSKFRFLGTPALSPAALLGEATTLTQFKRDPYGCKDKLLKKKAGRNPFANPSFQPSQCPAMSALLSYCGPNVFAGPLPWGEFES